MATTEIKNVNIEARMASLKRDEVGEFGVGGVATSGMMAELIR